MNKRSVKDTVLELVAAIGITVALFGMVAIFIIWFDSAIGG